MRVARALIAVAAAVACAGPATAQSPSVIGRAIAGGQAGERYDGYMGIVGAAPADVRRRVNAVNLRRRNLYIELAGRRNVTAAVVGLTAGCELLGRVTVGEAYLLADGVWRRRTAGETVRLPEYCR